MSSTLDVATGRVNGSAYLSSLVSDTYNSMESFNTLVLSLPTRNSTLRMRLWRALKETGCAVLRDGVYVLPANADAAGLAKLEADIRSQGGFAMTADLRPRTGAHLLEIRKLFDRSAEYGAFVERTAKAKAVL